MAGNTSINPFFYGTYLDVTKPGEPVTRTKKQAFQADAVGVVHQLTPSHFQTMHTFRLEWQPGKGGRIDWFTKGYKRENENGTYYETGDGDGTDWVPVFALKDEVLNNTMGSQIPIEPTYLIMNTAVSSTWGFPYDVPDWCEKCYDCDDPSCSCAFHPGFCPVMRQNNVMMKIDSIRVYQSYDASAHVGANHTLGCDPPEFPTKEFIRGHEYRYMRNPPFSYDDTHPLRPIQRGGGECKTDDDCGGRIQHENLTEAYLGGTVTAAQNKREAKSEQSLGMGRCVKSSSMPAMFTFATDVPDKICVCNPGFTGPKCHAQAHFDDSPSAEGLKNQQSPFRYVAQFQATPFMLFLVCFIISAFLILLVFQVQEKKRRINGLYKPKFGQPKFTGTGENEGLLITGSSI